MLLDSSDCTVLLAAEDLVVVVQGVRISDCVVEPFLFVFILVSELTLFFVKFRGTRTSDWVFVVEEVRPRKRPRMEEVL